MAAAPHSSSSSSEPTTPLWLTCVGAGLFFLAGLFMVFRAPAPEIEADSNTTPAAALTAAAKPAAPAAAAPAARMADPDAIKRLQERLQQAPRPAGNADPHAGHGH